MIIEKSSSLACRFQIKRSFCNVSNAKQSTEKANIRETVAPFEDIPEPKSLPIIGTTLDYTPFRGFQINRINEHWARRHQEYGDIYKEKIMSKYWVFCRSKEDNERLFRMEGSMPFRAYFKELTTVKHMMGYPDSIANEKGEKWLQLRQPVNKLLLKKPSVWRYAEKQQNVCEDAVEYIMQHRDEKFEVPNFNELLQAWAFEMAGEFVFNCRLGMLESKRSADTLAVFEGSKRFMELLGVTGVMALRKYTVKIGLKPIMLRWKEAMVSIIERQRYSANVESSVFHGIMNLETLTETQKESLLIDLLLGAVDTTSNTIALCLYCLSTNNRVQDKLRNEVMALNETQKPLGRTIEGMVYMNAFFKEAHRLFPFTHGLPRTFDHDVVLSGYNIPAGTLILNTINSTFNKNPEYFEHPEECLPERWLDKIPSRFTTSGPFGIGSRGCPGRFFAKQEVLLSLIAILRNFDVQYHYEPATSITRTTGILSDEPKFSFVSLN